MTCLLLLLWTALGLCVGSFCNVLIFRLPRGEEFVKTPSHCMACGHRLRWYELIPVASWLAQGGRCRSCGEKISAQYPVVEALQRDLKLGDVVAGMGACTNSNYAAQYGLGGTFAPIADFQLLSAAVESAKELGVRMDVGNLYSSDTFYDASNPSLKWADMGVLAIEMEAAALYCNAAYTKKRGLSLCSISDNILTGEELSPEARQTSFTAMMKIALETAVKMAAESQK